MHDCEYSSGTVSFLKPGRPGCPAAYLAPILPLSRSATWASRTSPGELTMPQGRFQSLQDPETLRLFIENLREGVYITIEAGEILDANPACLEIFGVASVEELRSHRAQDLFADPAQRDQELELLAREA